MQRVDGIGGYFIKARDPKALAEWYRDTLGIDTMDPDGQGAPWTQQVGPTIFATHAADSDYFGRAEQQTMLDFRVTDLDAMVQQLRDAGVTVEDIQEWEGIGRFSWATDPEGNRFELWEQSPED